MNGAATLAVSYHKSEEDTALVKAHSHYSNIPAVLRSIRKHSRAF